MEPLEDSLAIKDMRARMDSIHRYGHRPTVALVLSGGGAKGAAHVGAIKYLEEQGIPVDVVLGTSIGGLIAGMYSMGYNSDEMIDIMRAQDWGITLTDRVNPKYIPYTTKLYKEKYVLPIPFHYEDETFEEPAEKRSFLPFKFRSPFRKSDDDEDEGKCPHWLNGRRLGD